MTKLEADHSGIYQTAVNPQFIFIGERHIFLNGDYALTEIGSKIQGISLDIGFLRTVWEIPDTHKLVTQKRLDEMVEQITCNFFDIADNLGIPQDLSLLHSLLDRYKQLVDGRENMLLSK